MSCINRIMLLTLSICYLALASVCVYGQNKPWHSTTGEHKQNLTVGFRTGQDALFPTHNYNKAHYAISSTLFLRKAITSNFFFETGLKYSVIQSGANPFTKPLSNANALSKKPFSLSVPVTIQYYFLPEKSRVRPYIGGGMQYVFMTKDNNITPFNTDYRPDLTDQTGTKYISILFTQGVTFEINTKIQVNQSFHFLPESTNRTFGVDIGIGFKLP
jgi:outer membrane protein W